MLGIQIRQPRFNLYDLDEGEMFIKEFAVTCQFVYPDTEKVENLSGVILIGSRSLIFEPDDHSYSIIKFHFRYFVDRPRVVIIDNKEMFKGIVNKLIEIPHGKIIQPFKTHDIKTDIYIHYLFEKIEVVAHIIYELIDKFNSKHSYFDFDNMEYLGNLYSFKFDYTRIKSINEIFLLKQELFVKQLLPLIEVPGLLMLTDNRIYFQPLFTLNTKKSTSLKYIKINKLFKRRVKLREIGLEICSDNKNILLQFDNESDRDMIYEIIFTHSNNKCETNISIDNYTKAWVDGSMSNYDYLIALNSAANRTRNDLSQYPIFPWILSNYESSILDLTNINNFRDLSKPIGALETKRLDAFKERFLHMPEPKFLYGTHYSNPAYVIGYLVRKYPKYMIKLHGGRFDHPDRLFNSIEIDWKICLTNPGSLKELIPEFYEDNPDFLLNLQDIDFGLTNKNEKISHVRLPNWSNDAIDFLRKMRESLESEIVSKNLHNWIDLIFGYKQRGQAAIDANNLFHPLTYDGNTDITKIQDPIAKNAIETQVNEYGQAPKQLFKIPHPRRFSNRKEIKLEIENIKEIKVEEIEKEPEKIQYEKIEANFNFNRNYIYIPKFHKKAITSSLFQTDNKTFITGSSDGFIKLYDYKNNKVKRMFSICNFPLTTMTFLNTQNVIAIGSTDNMIHIFNTSIGKEINHIYAHEDSVVKIFYNNNNLISDGADSTCKVWDVSNNQKIPVVVFYDTDSKIISADFQYNNEIHMCADEDCVLVIRDIKNEKDFNKIQLEKSEMKYVKFNHINPNEYFICTKDYFKIYDIRTNKEINSIDQFKNSFEIFNDSVNFLLTFEDCLKLYSDNLIREWNEFETISHINMNIVNFMNPEIIILGNSNGDLYYA